VLRSGRGFDVAKDVFALSSAETVGSEVHNLTDEVDTGFSISNVDINQYE
jgi:folate-dependent phosphoribosylglycinamide formyltransferase PurN